ncbi:MAG: phage/plasmid primase, P4 family [Thermoguttaceae bacterium]
MKDSDVIERISSTLPHARKDSNGTASSVSDTVEFFQSLFSPGDMILFRPIETWTEANHKKSKVDYKGIQYTLVGLKDQNGQWQSFPQKLASAINRQIKCAEQTHANIFFGACPRFGTGGQYDQAWQIRVVRTLWSDIDDCQYEEAIQRCKDAGIPRPSIVVNSGNGCHLYFLLAEPFLIDDAGTPPAVHVEFIDDQKTGNKKHRSYILDESKEKVYLDKLQNVPPLSSKALHFQDVLSGMAAKIGGDHTQDLSRLLRVPGTLNRKDQRNGREPRPCELVHLNPDARYPFSDFEKLADESPSHRQREQISKVKLPTSKKITPKRHDQFNDLIMQCEVAPVGTRSETDYALCCWAIEHGIPQANVWDAVQNVGKFAGNEKYFLRTWDKAANHTRDKIYTKAVTRANKKKGDKETDNDPGLVKTLADAICLKEYFAQDGGGKLYRYDGGAYRPGAEKYVKAIVKASMTAWGDTKAWSTRLASEVVEFVRVDAPELPDRPRMDLVNVLNGMVRADGVLLPHDPKYLSVVQLPVKYDPAATCPNIEAFVKSTFPTDAHDLAWEIPGVLMVPATWLQKAILLLGEGCNGKSVWLSLLTRFLGRHNIAAIPLHKLEADKFSVSRLVGKLANICADLPSEHLAGTSTFKALTGGDTLNAEYKFKDSFDLEPFARLVFSANYPPRSADSSAAFFRRWIVIPFDHTFGPDEQIPRDVLDARLQSPEELSGMFNRAIEGLRRVEKQRRFSDSPSVQEAWRDFHATTDPLSVWLDRYTIDDPDSFVTKQALRVTYNAAVEREGRPTMTDTAFSLAIQKLRPNIEKKQRTVAGKLQWCFTGIGMLHPDNALQNSLFPPNPTDNSQTSQGSQGSHTCYQRTRAREEIDKDICSSKYPNRENPVNPVNPVTSYPHNEVEETRTADGYINQQCRDCRAWLPCRKEPTE